MRLAARGFEGFLHLTGLLGEAGIPVLGYHGANELSVADDATVDDPELRDEIARTLRRGSVPGSAPNPPGGGDAPAPAESSQRGTEDSEQGQDDLPPRAGRGSSRDAWAAAAEQRGLTVTDDMTRDDIVQLVEDSEDGR